MQVQLIRGITSNHYIRNVIQTKREHSTTPHFMLLQLQNFQIF